MAAHGTVEAKDALVRSIARDCLLTRTRQISRVLTSIYDDELRAYDINASQFSLLAMILEFGPLSRADLARRNRHDRSTLSRNLQPLIQQGWVAQGASRSDGRSRPLSVTAPGRVLLGRAAPAWSNAQHRARTALGEHGVSGLMSIAAQLPFLEA